MEAIGDYLYIIIFVGIIIINILRNLSKQKTVATPDASGNYPESGENEEGDFLGNPPPQPRQEPTFQVQQVQSRPKNVETTFPKHEFKEKKVNHSIQKEEDHNPVSVTFNDTDDARKAFIYAEIWNRKY